MEKTGFAPECNDGGLPGLRAALSSSGTALMRHSRDSRLFGLSYAVKPLPDDPEWYRLRIENWAYGVHNDSIAIPVLDFTFRPCSGARSRDIPVCGLKVLSRPVPDEDRMGERALAAALFLINQINAGQVPDCHQILRLHRLYPGADA